MAAGKEVKVSFVYSLIIIYYIILDKVYQQFEEEEWRANTRTSITFEEKTKQKIVLLREFHLIIRNISKKPIYNVIISVCFKIVKKMAENFRLLSM